MSRHYNGGNLRISLNLNNVFNSLIVLTAVRLSTAHRDWERVVRSMNYMRSEVVKLI